MTATILIINDRNRETWRTRTDHFGLTLWESSYEDGSPYDERGWTVIAFASPVLGAYAGVYLVNGRHYNHGSRHGLCRHLPQETRYVPWPHFDKMREAGITLALSRTQIATLTHAEVEVVTALIEDGTEAMRAVEIVQELGL